MSYPLQPYIPNNPALVERPQQFNRPVFDANPDVNNLLGSLFGLATQLMGEVLRNAPALDGLSSFTGVDPTNPHVKIFGISSMNMTQIARGPDGRPHIIQAQDERRLGPNGIWQTKRALRDSDRGIDKMQIGYFAGDQGKIIERQFDPTTKQYRQQVQQRPMPRNIPKQPSQAYQRPLPMAPSQQYSYYPRQQQQASSSGQQPLQALPAPSRYARL